MKITVLSDAQGLTEVALAARTLCRELNTWFNSFDLPEQVLTAQNILEEILSQNIFVEDAPAPLPVAEPGDAGAVERYSPVHIRFIDGEPDYQSGGDGQALEEIY